MRDFCTVLLFSKHFSISVTPNVNFHFDLHNSSNSLILICKLLQFSNRDAENIDLGLSHSFYSSAFLFLLHFRAWFSLCVSSFWMLCFCTIVMLSVPFSATWGFNCTLLNSSYMLVLPLF